MKKSAGESTSDRNHVNAELSAVVKYLDNRKDMCDAKAESHGRGRRGAAETSRFNEALSILSESPLLQQPRRKIRGR